MPKHHHDRDCCCGHEAEDPRDCCEDQDDACACGCHDEDDDHRCDCGCHDAPRLVRRFRTREEQIQALEEYLADLRAEAQAVQEHIDALRG